MEKKFENSHFDQFINKKDQQIEFASFVLDYNFTLIKHVEAKSSMVLWISGIILSVLLGLFPNLKGSTCLSVLFSSLIISCVISGLFAIESIRSRFYDDEPYNHVYFSHIVKMKRQDYINSFKEMSETKIPDNMLNPIYSLAMIQNTKYKLTNRAIFFLYITFILLGINAIAYVFWN